MSKYAPIAFGLIIILAVAALAILKNMNSPQEPNSNSTQYFIDSKEVDEPTFTALINTLLVSEASSDITTTAGGYSRHAANDAQGNLYRYDAGEENGITKLKLSHNGTVGPVIYTINGKEADAQTFINLRNTLTVEEMLNDEQSMRQGRYIYVATDGQGNIYNYESGRKAGTLFFSLDKNPAKK